MNDREDPSKEFIYAGDLVQVTLTLLYHLQDIQAEKIRAVEREGGGRRGGGVGGEGGGGRRGRGVGGEGVEWE